MVNLKLNQLELGMVLALDVKDRTGRVLLTAGNSINEKHVKIFRSWGVTNVAIQGNGKEEERLESKANPNLYKEVEEKFSDLFRHTDQRHPAIKELYQLCIARKMDGPSQSGDGND